MSLSSEIEVLKQSNETKKTFRGWSSEFRAAPCHGEWVCESQVGGLSLWVWGLCGHSRASLFYMTLLVIASPRQLVDLEVQMGLASPPKLREDKEHAGGGFGSVTQVSFGK